MGLHPMRSRRAGFFLRFLCGLLFVFRTGAIAAMERRKEQEDAEGAENFTASFASLRGVLVRLPSGGAGHP